MIRDDCFISRYGKKIDEHTYETDKTRALRARYFPPQCKLEVSMEFDDGWHKVNTYKVTIDPNSRKVKLYDWLWKESYEFDADQEPCKEEDLPKVDWLTRLHFAVYILRKERRAF